MSDLLHKESVETDERREQADRAVKAFRKLQPILTSYAKVLSRNPKARVDLAATSNGSTDGNRIFYRPPIALGDKTPHETRLCNSRDDLGIMACPACAIREEVLVTIYHEIAHICFDSFARITESDKTNTIEWALKEVGTKWGEQVRKRIEGNLRLTSYVLLARTINPYLPFIVNCLEDARVNEQLFQARKGVRKMFDADTARIFREGFESKKADGSIEIVRLEEQPLNNQIMIGVFSKASGYDYSNWFAPKIVEDLGDSELAVLLDGMQTVRSASSVYNLALKVLARLRAMGYLATENDPDPEPEESDDGEGTDPSDSEEGESDSDPVPSESGEPDDEDGDEPSAGGDEGEAQPDEGDASPSDDAEGDSDGGSDGEEGEVDDTPNDDSDDREGEAEGDPESGAGDPSEGGAEASNDPHDTEGTDDSHDHESEEGGDSPEPGDWVSPSDSGDEGEGDGGTDSRDDPEADLGDAGHDGSDLDSERPAGSEDVSGDSDGGADDASRDEASDVADGDAGDAESGGEPGRGDISAPAGSGVEGMGADQDDPVLADSDPSPESGSDDEPASPDSDSGEVDTEPIDTGADDGYGGTELIGDEGGPQLDYGTPEDLGTQVVEWMGHGEKPKTAEVQADEKAVDTAIVQGLYFTRPSSRIGGVIEHRHDAITDAAAAWTSRRQPIRVGQEGDFNVPEQTLQPALLRTRRTFSDNRRGKTERNKRSGHVNLKALGKRAPLGDDRIFAKKSLPGRKDYFVVIAMDVSGSTVGVNLALEKRAVMAQAELLERVGIPFAIYAHTGGQSVLIESGLDLQIYIVKEPHEKWTGDIKQRLLTIGHSHANLDGHAMEYLRKRLDESNATDKILLYYSDGKMPLENFDEELLILQSEIATCKRKGYTLLGVGIRTDSPARHGLDTVEVHDDNDLVKVVDHLGKRLARGK